MFLSARLRAQPEFRQGARDMLPQAPGIAAWGLMTGVAMVKSGMSVLESLLMALLVFAGSSQLAAVPLIVAGAPIWVILATGFCVNLRFVVFSLHLRPYLMHLPLWRRLTHGYLTADLTYVLFTQRYPRPAHEDPSHDVAAQRVRQDAVAARREERKQRLAVLVAAMLAPERTEHAQLHRVRLAPQALHEEVVFRTAEGDGVEGFLGH